MPGWETFAVVTGGVAGALVGLLADVDWALFGVVRAQALHVLRVQ